MKSKLHRNNFLKNTHLTTTIPVNLLILPALSVFLSACSSIPPIYPTAKEEIYLQDSIRKIDILLVVDNSFTMASEQENLSTNFASFIESFQYSEVDYHIGVVTTDFDNNPDAGKLHYGDFYKTPFITPETPDAASVFAENVSVGYAGDSTEKGLASAHKALTEPNISGANLGFFREDASLSILVFSDEDDSSGLPPCCDIKKVNDQGPYSCKLDSEDPKSEVDCEPYANKEYLSAIGALKGDPEYRDHYLMNISAVVGDAKTEYNSSGGCFSSEDDHPAQTGMNYIYAAEKTGGVVQSICSSSYTNVLSSLGLGISGLRHEFPLQYCARPDTIVVYVDDVMKEQGVDYIYVPEDRLVRFKDDKVPPENKEIKIRYLFYPEDDLASCPTE